MPRGRAYLAGWGIAAETARAALAGDDETELAAALSLARRPRIGQALVLRLRQR